MAALRKKELLAELRKAGRSLLPFLLAFWTGLAVCSTVTDKIARAFIVVLLCLFYQSTVLKHREKSVRLKTLDKVVLLFFASGLEAMKYPHYIFTIIASKTQILTSCFYIAGYWIFAAAAMERFLGWLYRWSAQRNAKNTQAACKPEAVQKRMTAAILVIGLPYLYAFYPGGVYSDMFEQINSYYEARISDHHPVLTTYLNVFLVQLGSHISDNFGIFICNLVQYLLFCLAVGYLLGMLYQLTESRKTVLVCLLFYVLVPAFYHFSYLLEKEGIYSPLLVLYCCLIIKFLLETKLSKREWALFAALNVLLLLVRKEGIYVVGISAAALLCVSLQNVKVRKQLLCVLALILCVHVGYHQIFLRVLHIPEGDIREALNVPLMQTALFIKEEYDDITEEEYLALQAVFDDDLVKIGEYYDPVISDGVKAHFRQGLDREAYRQYFSAYVHMGLRHPGIYVRALLEHISAYIFPERYWTWYIYMDLDELGEEWKSPYLNVCNDPAPAAAAMRQLYHRYTSTWENFPALSLTTSPGAYTWVYLFLFALLFRLPDKKYLAAFIPILCVWGVSCLSPVNGYTRYFIPIEMALPIYIGYTLKLYAMHRKPSSLTDEPPILT